MIPWRSRELYVIISVSLSAVMGVSLISPSLPVIRDIFDLSDVEAGYIITLYTLPAIFLAPVAGLLTDRLGRRRVLVPSLLAFGATGTAISLVGSFGAVLILRFLQGIGSISLALISRTLVGDVYDGQTQNAAMGLNDAVLALGAAFFPVLGGYLAEHQWYYPFLLYAFPCLVAVFSYLALPTIPIESDEEKQTYIKNGLKLLLRRRILLLLVATLLAFVLLYGAIQTVLPLFLDNVFEYSPNTIGLYVSGMATMIALTSFFNGQLIEHFSNRQLIIGGFALYSLGLMLLGTGTDPVGTFLGLGLFGIGHGLTLPSMNTGLVRSVGTGSRGAMMSLRTIFSRLGQTTGPVLFPLLGIFVRYPTLYLTTGLITLAGTVCVTWLSDSSS